MRGLVAVVGLTVFVLGCGSDDTVEHIVPYDDGQANVIAQRIRNTYEGRFLELDQSAQAHFAIRTFRATGESSQLDAVRVDMARMVHDLDQTLDSLEVKGYLERRSDLAHAQKRDVTPVLRARKNMFASRKEMLVHRQILYSASKLKDSGLHKGEFRDEYEGARRHLQQVDFAAFLLDPEVIRHYAAQTSNLVFWLQGIKVVDLEDEYTHAFQSVFMSGEDTELSEADYQNKLYGLTHFIIGDSRYYQRMVSAKKHKWILDYFDRHILEILTWSKPDILAEIGLCFRLCGLSEHRVVKLVQEYLSESYDSSLGFIPSQTGSTDINLSEHRNAVAYLVLSDWESLHQGPILKDGDIRSLFLSGGGSGSAVENLQNDDFGPAARALDGAMTTYMKSNGISAGILGVMKDGEVIYEHSYGWKDQAHTEPIGPNAVMRIASVTKPFTAAAIRRMIESGIVRLDDHVFDLGQDGGGLLKIEPYPIRGDKRLKNVTIRHLLEHSGGWDSKSTGDLTFRELAVARDLGVPSPPSRAQVARWILGQPLQFSPGKRHIYSNEGYFFLGLIIEQCSGRSYMDYLYSEVLKPAGIETSDIILARTRLSDQDGREPYYDSGGGWCVNVVEPGSKIECAYGGWYVEDHISTGGLVASPRGLLRFLNAYYVVGPRIGAAMDNHTHGRWKLSHTGGFSGTSALARQRGDGIHYAVIFNKQAPPPADYASGIRELLDRIIEEKIKPLRGDVEPTRHQMTRAEQGLASSGGAFPPEGD